MKYIYIMIIVFFLQGCAITTNTINKTNYKSSPVKQTEKIISVKKDSSSLYNIQMQTVKESRKNNFSKALYTGSIKGIIKNLVFDKTKKLWLYEIYGRDMSNGKLPYAKFYYSKKLANKGDFVYAILNNSILRDLFFIKKANKILKKSKKVKKYKKIQKTDKTRKSSEIGVPSVENVTF